MLGAFDFLAVSPDAESTRKNTKNSDNVATEKLRFM
jgi:hypothetical protein